MPTFISKNTPKATIHVKNDELSRFSASLEKMPNAKIPMNKTIAKTI